MQCAVRNLSKFIKTAFYKAECNAQHGQQIRSLRTLRSTKREDDELKELADINRHSGEEQLPQNRSDVAIDLTSPREAHVPTFNLAAHVNNSKTLQQFLSLGVSLHKIERRKGLGEFLLRLDFEQDVKSHLTFLVDQGVHPDSLGELVTKNPLIFKEDLDDLQTRVEYLKTKRFSDEARQRIITENPYWLMYSTRRIDRRLGYFQKEFGLSGDNLRFLATKEPRIITYSLEPIRKSLFCMREEMGFNKSELRELILKKPKLLMIPPDDLIERFSYAHNEMGLSHASLLQWPELLTSREFRLRERHEFLKLLGRAQYDPQKDLYISPGSIVQGNNFYFVRHVAKSDIQTFDLFVKTR
ncbi:transcription termination factor 3, mitochondrial [Scaptodrosophila lebanonensis]|uniref:Transcription termination factor 3, mitochondrial n=1 Tax=Drosophila lebanonensis TaxID=7225 RepID=A0A6J2TLW0_DROLE|nr:transcription termination factor 3, mitochondrial [Scaptodrosophila lebanonensis]